MILRWTPDQLDQAVADSERILVDLRADWCTQCDPQERVLERVAPGYEERVKIVSIDVGEHPEIVDRYAIKTLPAFLLFTAGEHRQTVTGFRRAPELRSAIDDLLQSSPTGKE